MHKINTTYLDVRIQPLREAY